MFEIDELDKQILRILQVDASVTHRQIAQTLRRSITTIHDRISRLKQEGVILRSVAVLDRKKIGKGLLTFSHVLLNQHTTEVLEQFEKAVKKFPEVLECFQMTGSFDFLLRISTRDMEEYHEFYRYKLAKLPNITTVNSYFALSETKSVTAYPI
ncbi:Lrp/AsnC family transcriptional regulator [Niabella yanshanensis]|uniref:Lrp/AsnC family transcriptional regulator n=1 Tax=Niabella yanshanensis TaxID=577386 RepID=A0ABZ0WBK0_9BACT|nr:Lrp/AsnC family transcriptional regulator [Niabella yanshanensis]WQD38957.1 Lrp/AsnC family transcriptional regulator [Niabella yanshanensis]